MKTIEDLKISLSKAIVEYNDDNEVQDKMLQIYADKKLPLRTVGNVFKEYTQLDDLSEIEIGIWCYYLHEITNNKLIIPDDYYGAGQMKMDDIILEDVKEIIVNGKIQYVCPFVSYYTLYKISDNHLLTYNYKTQRKAKMEKYKEKIVSKANVNKNSVNQISELILDGKFIANLLTWNVRPSKNITRGFTYDRNTRILKITPSASLDIWIDDLDGRHRFEGACRAVEKANLENKHLDGGFIVSVLNLDVDTAQFYINIQNEHNPIDKEQIASFAKNDYNTFVKMINTYATKSDNKMYDMICSTVDEAELRGKYTSINLLSEGLKIGGTKLDDPFIRDIKVADFVEVFNTILEYYQYKYNKDDVLIKHETVLYEPNSFLGYICIANELIDMPNYKSVLMKLLKDGKINLDRNSHNWESLELFKTGLRSYKKIYEYFKSMVKIDLSESGV